MTRNLLHQADVAERVELVKGLQVKIAALEKIVETLRELFRGETNGEVLYWGVQILEDRKELPGALEIIYQKLDDEAAERYHEDLEKDMVTINAGTFMMGSCEESEDEDEKPVHEVRLKGFLMNRYQVINRLYEQFDPGHRKLRDEYSNTDDQPVIYVNWHEAVIFCRWLGCRLPTEAEWKFACRAGTVTPFYTGENLTTDQANYNGNYPYRDFPEGEYLKKTTAVGMYSPNPWGLYDMHGNVYEWCRDWLRGNYYEECKKRGTVDNPQWLETCLKCIFHGGYWNSYAQDCRSAYRLYGDPGGRIRNTGFRPVFISQ